LLVAVVVVERKGHRSVLLQEVEAVQEVFVQR
jgi:hypothetical protein